MQFTRFFTLLGLGLLLIGSGCSRGPSAREEADALRLAESLSSIRQQQEEIVRLTQEVRRFQDSLGTQSNAMVVLETELKEERQLRIQAEKTLSSKDRAREEASTKELKRQIAGMKLPFAKDPHFPGFRPTLINGCLVDSTEFAWAQDAVNRLSKEAKPRLLVVNHMEGNILRSHAYCTFQTPRGTWFAYNPNNGSQQLFSSQKPDAKEWGEELLSIATSSWFEDRK